jgi:starch-binding outer membrane protein, SusD/RagB family
MLRTHRRTPSAATRVTPFGRAALASAAAMILFSACYNYNLTDPNNQTLGSLTGNPTRASVGAAVTGIFDAQRQDAVGYIWRVGSMGREGINLSNNNQPDFQEPYFGPLSSSEFGASLWADEYVTIRDANIVLDAVSKVPDMSTGEKALTAAVAQTAKALMFMRVIETHAQLGAPVDVDRPPTAKPAPLVSEDSVYATALHTLDSARVNLAAGASASFPFSIPPGYSNFATPATFAQLTWALTAKALVLRATAQSHAAGLPGSALYYTQALAALDSSFLGTGSLVSSNLPLGAYFDFSTGLGDIQNTLADPLTGLTFFAIPSIQSDAKLQVGGTAIDARAVAKIDSIPPGSPPQVISGVSVVGDLKFAVYFAGGNPNLSAAIPIIRYEELVLLRAEAEIGTGNTAGALNDLNFVREVSGNLPPYGGATTPAALITELLYERRYSLLWEQGTRWIDARRFGVLSTIPPTVTGGHVPTVMPIPTTECDARSLPTPCGLGIAS